MCLSIFLFTLSLILSLLKKKPIWNKIDSIYSAVMEKLPVFISIVEKDGHGQEKLLTVLQLVKTYLHDEFKFDNFEEIRSWCVSQIESILSTPQKKEV